MSHRTGKVEVVGKMNGKIVFRYHRAPDPMDCGRLMIFDSDPSAAWLDDYMRAEAVTNFEVRPQAQTVSA
jgi:hypothetical protein